MIFPILTASDRSISFFYASAAICFQILHPIPREIGLSFSYALYRQREVDLNHLDYCAAWRFYCEYRTRERIHRGMLIRDY